MGGMTFTRNIPSFLKSMTAAADDDGIEGAIKRHRERHGDDEPSDRSEAEDEKPVIVEEGEGMTKKQKRRLEAHEGRGGSLQFKSSGARHPHASGWEALAAAPRTPHPASSLPAALRPWRPLPRVRGAESGGG